MEIANKNQLLISQRSSGTATTEFLVSLAFFVPVFITVPIVGKYIDFKQKNIESTRYAVWERTVWADPQGRWNDNENTKTDDTIGTEVDRRFYGSQMQGMASTKLTDNQLWVDRTGKKMLTLPAKGKKRVSVTVGEGVSPVKNRVVDNLAYKGVPYIGSAFSAITKFTNASIAKVIPGCKDIPGVDLKNGMNLGSKTYSSITVSASVKNFVPVTSNNNANNSKLTFTSSGSILSNAWTAPTEAIYKDRVDRLVIDETVRCIASPARLISIFPVYKEGKAAKNVQAGAKTTVLLGIYKK